MSDIKNMETDSFSDILKKYGIEEKDPDEIRRRLNKIRSNLHPDRFSGTGDFESLDKKEDFLIISEAINYLDDLMPDGNLPIRVESKALESLQESQDKLLEKIEEQNQILEEIKKRSAKEIFTSEISETAQRFSEMSKKRIKQISYSKFLPKVSIVTLTGIVTIIWFYPSTIESHPYLSQFIDIHTLFLTLTWFLLIIVSCILLYFLYLSESFQKQLIEKMNDETFQFSLVDHFINERKCVVFHNTVKSVDSDNFTKKDFIDYLNLYLFSIIKNIHFQPLRLCFDENARMLTLSDIKYYIPYYFKQILIERFKESDLPRSEKGFRNDEIKSPNWKSYRYESRLKYKNWLDYKSFPTSTIVKGAKKIDESAIQQQMFQTIENLFEIANNKRISEGNKQEINLKTFLLLDSGNKKMTVFQRLLLGDLNKNLEQEIKMNFISIVLLKAQQKEIIKSVETSSFEESYQIGYTA